MGLCMSRASHVEADRQHHRRQATDDEQRRVDGTDAVMPRFRVGCVDSETGAGAEVPVVDVSIVLPHDGIISTLFFGCWAGEVREHQTYYGCNRKVNRPVNAECKGLLTRVNDMVNKVTARPYEFRFVATFGSKVANDVDISKKVCFDYNFDDVVRDDSDIESRVPAYIVEGISRVHSTFDRYVKDVVRTPVILSMDEYVQAVRESFKATNARIRRITYGESAQVRDFIIYGLMTVRAACERAVMRHCRLDEIKKLLHGARSGHGRYLATIDEYKRQKGLFSGLMYVKMDKIPTQLQLCTITGLRRKMVRYLNDGARFRRIDGNADDITRTFHGYLLNMLNRLPGTIDHHTFLLLLPELLPRELDRRKPKGGDRPVCNMQAVLTAFIDQVCACIVTACLTEVDHCVRRLQSLIASAMHVDVRMIWSISRISEYIDMMQPGRAVRYDGHGPCPLDTLYSDVSGCFNNIPQGYPGPLGTCADALLENVDAVTSRLRQHHNYTADTSCGADTIRQLMAGAQPHDTLHTDHLDGLLAEMADGWPAEMFTRRADMDIAMFHRAIVTKACHVRAGADGVTNEEIVLQVPVATRTGVTEHSLDVTVGSGV
jgi:hypothetical protein